MQNIQKYGHMACSTQSALNYVKEARSHLVNGLKNHSLILENLNQRRVLGNEEVSKIEAEKDDYDKNRKILDSVIRKGEDACYEFLRIIYMTRKKSLGRTSLPKRKTVASTETKEFDLHNWISCFSFKEDTQMDTNTIQGILIDIVISTFDVLILYNAFIVSVCKY